MAAQHSNPRTGSRREHGLSLIEVAMILAVTAIVAATALPDFAAFIAARRLEGAATHLTADLQFVRSEALARNRSLRFSVRSGAGASCWIVHTGAAGDCDCAGAGGIVCVAGTTVVRSAVLPASERIGVAASVASMVFDPLHGTSTPTGTLRVTDGRGRAVHHIVNVVGRVRSCSPGRGIPGYPAC